MKIQTFLFAPTVQTQNLKSHLKNQA